MPEAAHARDQRDRRGPLAWIPHLLRGHVVEPVVREPLERVATALSSAKPPDGARAQVHAATGRDQVLGDLRPRLRTPHDEDSAIRQGTRGSIGGRVELVDRLGQVVGQARAFRVRLATRRHDDERGLQWLVIDGDPDEVRPGRPRARFDRGHLGAGPERQSVMVGVGLEPGHEGVAREEGVAGLDDARIVGKSVHPVGRVEGEGVPPLRAPGLADQAAFEDDVLDAEPRQVPARPETGLTAADDDGLECPHLTQAQAMAATLTGSLTPFTVASRDAETGTSPASARRWSRSRGSRRLRERRDAGRDVDALAAVVGAALVRVGAVEPDPDRRARSRCCRDGRRSARWMAIGAVDARAGGVEGREEPVTGRVDDLASAAARPGLGACRRASAGAAPRPGRRAPRPGSSNRRCR